MDNFINVSEGLGRMMNNQNLYVKMLTTFKNGSYLENLVLAVESGDKDKAVFEAHTLKGVAANLSFPAISIEAKALEAKLKSGESVDLTKIKNDVAQTLACIDQVLAKFN